MNEDNKRRDFIKKTGTVFTFGVFASTFSSVINSCDKNEIAPAPDPVTVDIDITKYPNLMIPGNFQLIELNLEGGRKQKIIINRIDDNNFVALDTICKHQGCEVTPPDSPTKDIMCYCHNVSFDLKNGKVKVKPISDHVPDLINFKVFSFDAANNILKVVI